MPPRRRQPAASDPPPPLPGGYTVGDKVFYTAASQTWEHGGATYKVVHGQPGEVVGPTPLESVKGKGVGVRFPGNACSINCFLTQVRRLRAASAATTPASRPTRDAAYAPCVPVTAFVAAPHSPHTACAAARTAAHCPGVPP